MGNETEEAKKPNASWECKLMYGYMFLVFGSILRLEERNPSRDSNMTPVTERSTLILTFGTKKGILLQSHST